MADKIMKILFVSDLYPPNSQGGYELRCAETANDFAARGHKVFVLTGKSPSIENQKGIDIYRLLALSPAQYTSLPRLLPRFMPLNKRAHQLNWAIQCRKNYTITYKLVGELKPDIVFLWNMQYLDVAPILAVQAHGIPTAYSLGGYWLLFLRNILKSEPDLIKRRFRGSIIGLQNFGELDLHHLIANSQMLKKSYVENGFPDEDITVIPRGIPSDQIVDIKNHYSGNNHATQKLLFVGRITPDKAPDIAIKATWILVNKYGLGNITLDIIGTGAENYINELKAMVSTLKLDRNINFLGHLSRSELLDRYFQYNCLLFPARWEEPFGGTILEAMARGLPVIATNRGGIPELITNGETGFLVPTDAPDALAEKTSQLLEDLQLANRFREEAVKKIRDKYTLEKVNDEILEYLASIIIKGKVR